MEEQIHGLTLRDCAKILAKHTELRTQYGERSFKPHLHAFLAEVGTDESTWARSWNAWNARMDSDPSGQLTARFATFQQEQMLAAHMGDVRDMSQDAKEGVTLDAYARIMAQIAGGGDAEAILAAEGLPMDRWLAAQEGWNAAMAADIKLTTQYGMLYAQHTPGFQQQMEQQVAAHMAADYERRAGGDDDTEEEEEYTFEKMVAELSDKNRNTRWTAAHHVCNRWDIGDRDDPELASAAKRAYELAHECLEGHDEFTVSNAEALARDLKMFASEGYLTAEMSGDCTSAIGRCLERGREALGRFEDAFAPIADKRVPERVTLQSHIQDYTSLVEELTEILEEWEDSWEAPSAPEAATPSAVAPSGPASRGSAPSASVAVAKPESPNPLLMILRALPVIGPIVRALGL